MSNDLESPYLGGVPDWDALYRSRGDEVSCTRPIFTGDVFTGVRLPGSTGSIKERAVIVLQHPCSMRTNGVDLAWQVLVAEVTNRKELDEPGWGGGNYNLMPMPNLRPGAENQSQHQAANFDNLYTIAPDLLTLPERLASLSPFGVNLLLQRWVHYSSRVVISGAVPGSNPRPGLIFGQYVQREPVGFGGLSCSPRRASRAGAALDRCLRRPIP